ncbi:MAG: SgcJ/EcaC family oxidoreductase [Gemmatales bacterium]
MRQLFILAVAFVSGTALTMAYSTPFTSRPMPQSQAANADHDAILKTAREFAEAYNRGDAKALAAQCTERCEIRESGGELIVGRDAIEKAYAQYFKNNKGATIEVLVKSVRFPAKDLAIEEGLLRQATGPAALPTTTSYVATHVREDGQWKLALSNETGEGQNRLEDLDWLIGNWTTKVKNETVNLSFVRDSKRPMITATFTRTAEGKAPITGSIRIALDPETGLIRSWGFEDDGGHAQSLWHNDGKSWILDQQGVLGDGTPTAERIVLHRVSANVITWRVIDRLLGDEKLPDSAPLRLTRMAAK